MWNLFLCNWIWKFRLYVPFVRRLVTGKKLKIQETVVAWNILLGLTSPLVISKVKARCSHFQSCVWDLQWSWLDHEAWSRGQVVNCLLSRLFIWRISAELRLHVHLFKKATRVIRSNFIGIPPGIDDVHRIVDAKACSLFHFAWSAEACGDYVLTTEVPKKQAFCGTSIRWLEKGHVLNWRRSRRNVLVNPCAGNVYVWKCQSPFFISPC